MEGGSEADVFHFYTGWQQFYVDAGLVPRSTRASSRTGTRCPRSTRPSARSTASSTSSPWDWGFTSILYNTEQVPRSRAGTRCSTTYDGHVSMWNDGPGAVTVSSYIHGYDETAITDEQLAEIEGSGSPRSR